MGKNGTKGGTLLEGGSKQAIFLRIRAIASPTASTEDQEVLPISVTLRPPSESSQAGWAINSAQIEAILGLWMWSLIYDERLKTKDDAGPRGSLAKKYKPSRIVSVGCHDGTRNDETNRQLEMDLWLGSDAVKLFNATVTVDERETPGFIKVWRQGTLSKDTDWITLSKGGQPKEKSKAKTQLFCGWNPAYESLASETSTKLRVQFTSTDHSLLDICTQELFTALAVSLAALPGVAKTKITERGGHERPGVPGRRVIMSHTSIWGPTPRSISQDHATRLDKRSGNLPAGLGLAPSRKVTAMGV
ncbi:hypothetical protein FOTG_19262 [Fusarium oxysporum f. sp. vasinfectum 25433]|uniref:Uncharacterized protein n=1 Tax=Fusarium oxysporum f. sp. vasinfectum 25433 TaxID=1089449 RepID=X0KTW9_FUSOX|nr:hypothetical protein FOTG_19262 [Fusarium oxysporum f. sp. vasinfectum 25433]